MASIRREVVIHSAAEEVWDALRDVGALHERLVPGFVISCALEGDVRTVTFFNGMIAKELIVAVDDLAKRVVWSAVGGRLTHHNASAQVHRLEAESCRVEWIADLLPNELAPAIAGMIEQGLAAMKRHAERESAA
ncbi:MAG: SRPBCC family protein [Ideonella sp.]|nr:SRPBCC family protein [Ideonella sp.]